MLLFFYYLWRREFEARAKVEGIEETGAWRF